VKIDGSRRLAVVLTVSATPVSEQIDGVRSKRTDGRSRSRNRVAGPESD
jgi:hypothetical protein